VKNEDPVVFPAEDGKINIENSIPLSILRKKTSQQKAARPDIFVDELSDFISVVEIKSTDWDKVKEKNRKKLLGSHRRQVWRYIEESDNSTLHFRTLFSDPGRTLLRVCIDRRSVM